jgi:hypothetical protein
LIVDPQKRTPEEEQKIRDEALDDTLANTFPASDPLSTDPNPVKEEPEDSGSSTSDF